MNFDISFIKIGWKMGKLWAFKEMQIFKHPQLLRFSTDLDQIDI